MPPVTRPIPRPANVTAINAGAAAHAAGGAAANRAAAGHAVDAGTAAKKHVGDKLLDGVSIGLVFAVLISFEPHGHFQKFLAGFLLSLHPVAGLLGLVAALCYPRLNGSFLKKMCSSWFDLTQQFFLLAAGAYLPVLAAGKLAARFNSAVPWSISFAEMFGCLVILGFALVLGGLWAVKDMVFAYRKPADFACLAAIAVVAILIAFSLKNPTDGGRQFIVESLRAQYSALEKTALKTWQQTTWRLPSLPSIGSLVDSLKPQAIAGLHPQSGVRDSREIR
jgi:hypothetical protein